MAVMLSKFSISLHVLKKSSKIFENKIRKVDRMIVISTFPHSQFENTLWNLYRAIRFASISFVIKFSLKENATFDLKKKR